MHPVTSRASIIINRVLFIVWLTSTLTLRSSRAENRRGLDDRVQLLVLPLMVCL